MFVSIDYNSPRRHRRRQREELFFFALDDDVPEDCYIFLSTFPERSTVITLDEMMERHLACASSFFSLFLHPRAMAMKIHLIFTC